MTTTTNTTMAEASEMEVVEVDDALWQHVLAKFSRFDVLERLSQPDDARTLLWPVLPLEWKQYWWRKDWLTHDTMGNRTFPHHRFWQTVLSTDPDLSFSLADLLLAERPFKMQARDSLVMGTRSLALVKPTLPDRKVLREWFGAFPQSEYLPVIEAMTDRWTPEERGHVLMARMEHNPVLLTTWVLCGEREVVWPQKCWRWALLPWCTTDQLLALLQKVPRGSAQSQSLLPTLADWEMVVREDRIPIVEYWRKHLEVSLLPSPDAIMTRLAPHFQSVAMARLWDRTPGLCPVALRKSWWDEQARGLTVDSDSGLWPWALAVPSSLSSSTLASILIQRATKADGLLVHLLQETYRRREKIPPQLRTALILELHHWSEDAVFLFLELERCRQHPNRALPPYVEMAEIGLGDALARWARRYRIVDGAVTTWTPVRQVLAKGERQWVQRLVLALSEAWTAKAGKTEGGANPRLPLLQRWHDLLHPGGTPVTEDMVRNARRARPRVVKRS